MEPPFSWDSPTVGAGLANPAPSTRQPERVLITGAAGYTGLALALHLLAGGTTVRALVRRPLQDGQLAGAGAEILTGDIRDPSVARSAVEGVDTVYHLAAVFRRAGVPDSEYRGVHVHATSRLVECSAAAGVRRFVHCSTVGVHGDVGQAPVNEDGPLRPADIYQRTKLEGEQAAVRAAERVGLPLTVVRPGPIYGPGDRRLLKIIGGVARRRFWVLGNGMPRLQMVYIDDLLEGIRLAGESPKAPGRIYILAGEEAPTLNELVGEIAVVAGVEPPRWRLPVWPLWLAGATCEAVCVPLGIEPPIFRRRVKFFTSSRWFDISRARDELGFRPMTPLRVGLARTLASYRQLGWV
ncbi:MAG TPA: NAD-dependent epimerase/dehydratase family protein [Gemmatimonadales bacterium]